MDQFVRLFFSTTGRITRQDFWTGVLAVVLVLAIAFIVVRQTIGAVFTAQVVLFVVELVLAYPLYSVLAKRLQDRGRPGGLAAIGVGIPLAVSALSLAGVTGTEESPSLLAQLLGYLDLLVLAWIVVDLGILPGMPGPNPYGPDPLAQA